MPGKTSTVNLRRTIRQGHGTSALLLTCLLLTGCAQNTYTVRRLPREYAAKPTSDFSTLDLTAWARPIPSGDQIQSGDRLKLSVNSGIGGPEAVEEWTVGVDHDGAATIPHVGRIRLAGLTLAEAEQSITEESIGRDVYLTPAVDVQVEERNRNEILVTGAVENPGTLEFPEDRLSLADILVRTGGLTPEATGRITVNTAQPGHDTGDRLHTVSRTRTQGTTGEALTVDLATTPAAELAAIEVPGGAAVNVEAAGERTVQVIGVIGDRPVTVPAGRNLRLLEALALAGGPTYSHWISNRIDVIRRIPEKNETIRIKTSIRKAKKDDRENLLLAPGDIVSVEENLLSFTLSALGGLTGLTSAARYATLP